MIVINAYGNVTDNFNQYASPNRPIPLEIISTDLFARMLP